MSTVKVSALAETTSPQANDELLVNQSGVSKKLKVSNFVNAAITANTAKTTNATHTGVERERERERERGGGGRYNE